jgi:hypothetical protein
MCNRPDLFEGKTCAGGFPAQLNGADAVRLAAPLHPVDRGAAGAQPFRNLMAGPLRMLPADAPIIIGPSFFDNTATDLEGAADFIDHPQGATDMMRYFAIAHVGVFLAQLYYLVLSGV